MREFGTEEYGNKDGFRVIYNHCDREARIVPTHHYSSNDKHFKKSENYIGNNMCMW